MKSVEIVVVFVPIRFIDATEIKKHVEPVTFNPLLDRDDLRLRIDREEDWDHLREITEAVDIQDCDWQRIAGLLDGQPALRKRMARLNEAVVADR